MIETRTTVFVPSIALNYEGNTLESVGIGGELFLRNTPLSSENTRLKIKNEKLQNLMQRRVKDYMYESCGDCWGGLCDECQCWVSECADELRELGIEVE